MGCKGALIAGSTGRNCRKRSSCVLMPNFQACGADMKAGLYIMHAPS